MDHCILTDLNYATLTSLYIFQKTVDGKLPLLRLCHHELVSSANTSVLIIQLNASYKLRLLKHFLSGGYFKPSNKSVQKQINI